MLTAIRDSVDSFLENLPVVREARAAAFEKHMAEMRAAEAALAAIEKQELSDSAKVQKLIPAADEKVAAALAALEKAKRERGSLAADLHNVSARADMSRRLHQQILATGNAEIVTEWREKFLGEMNRLRGSGVAVAEHETKNNGLGDAILVCVSSNLASIHNRIAACVAACRRAEELKVTSADVGSELATLWDSLPAIKMEKPQ